MTFLRKTSLLFIATLLSAAFLSGCGWSLRGAGMIPDDLTALHVSAKDPNGKLGKDLSQALRSAGVNVPASATEAELSLVIIQERSLVKVASLNENARVSEQELTEQAQFMIINQAGEHVIAPSRVTVERIFEYDENNVLATQDERELIRKEMRRDLIIQMLNRLRQLR